MSNVYALNDTMSEPIRSMDPGLKLPPVSRNTDFGQKVQQHVRHEKSGKFEQGRSGKFSKEMVAQKTEKLNQLAEILNRKIQFDVDSKDNKVIVKVIDPKTGEVIRKIPPEKIFKIEEQIDHAVGFILDERV